jgi:hypothetical protein
MSDIRVCCNHLAMIIALTITATSLDRKNAQHHTRSRDEATTTTAR